MYESDSTLIAAVHGQKCTVEIANVIVGLLASEKRSADFSLKKHQKHLAAGTLWGV